MKCFRPCVSLLLKAAFFMRHTNALYNYILKAFIRNRFGCNFDIEKTFSEHD